MRVDISLSYDKQSGSVGSVEAILNCTSHLTYEYYIDMLVITLKLADNSINIGYPLHKFNLHKRSLTDVESQIDLWIRVNKWTVYSNTLRAMFIT